MKTISTTRIDDRITIYRDRIIVPRKVATTYSESDGASKTDISYTASIFDDENRDESVALEIDECKTLDGAIRIAKLTIDLDIEKFREWIG
jgi:hypothetical protein